MIVVLDTNIWLKELALNSGAGSALRFFLKHRSAQLAVPEVALKHALMQVWDLKPIPLYTGKPRLTLGKQIREKN